MDDMPFMKEISIKVHPIEYIESRSFLKKNVYFNFHQVDILFGLLIMI